MSTTSFTKDEREARDLFTNLFLLGIKVPIDATDVRELKENELPVWYNLGKFKRAQKYYKENKFGMLMSNYYGLVCLFSESKGLDVLVHTNNTSNSSSARKRYVSTILQVGSWYENDLKPESESWKSLARVRRIHLTVSNSMLKSNTGLITQMLVALTAFGFVGFALIKPHHFAIRTNNREDREAFVHFWAVILHMMGVDDQFNYFLARLEVVEHFCKMILRYIFIPLVQLESTKYKNMLNAMLSGMSMFLPSITMECEIFMVRRLCSIPGYQYDIDVAKEILCPDMYTAEEIELMKSSVRNVPFQLANISYFLFYEPRIFETSNDSVAGDWPMGDRGSSIFYPNLGNTYDDLNLELLRKYVGLDADVELTQRIVPSCDWSSHFNADKFNYLSIRSKFCVRLRCLFFRMNESNFFRPVIDWVADRFIANLQQWQKRNSYRNVSRHY